MKRNRKPKKVKGKVKIKRTTTPIKLIELKHSELKRFRKRQWKRQKCKCAILKQHISLDVCTLDHQHKLKTQKAGPKGRGLIRGVLQFQANSLEGVITKKFKRYGLHKFISLPKFLRNMADYLDSPPVPPKYIHPTEIQKEILRKSDYNLVVKYYPLLFPRRKIQPYYPKKGIKVSKSGIKTFKAKLTPKWEKLIALAKEYRENENK